MVLKCQLVLTIEKGKVEGIVVVRFHWDEVAQHVCGGEAHLILFPNKKNGPQCRHWLG